MIRLELQSPDLVAKLRTASVQKQHAASLLAAEFAISYAQVQHPLAEKALKKVRATGRLIPQEKAEIDALAAQLDEEYFNLQEAADEGKAKKDDYLRVFAKARAFAALSCAGDEDAFKGAVEAIYEAAATINGDDKGDLFAMVASVLDHDQSTGSRCLSTKKRWPLHKLIPLLGLLLLILWVTDRPTPGAPGGKLIGAVVLAAIACSLTLTFVVFIRIVAFVVRKCRW